MLSTERLIVPKLLAAAGLAVSAAALTLPVHAASNDSFKVWMPGEVTFEHIGQQIDFRTQISLFANWQFTVDSSATLEASLLLSPDNPAGFGSWNGPDATGIGPTALYLTRDGTGANEFRQWRRAEGQSGTAPELVVPLALALTEQQGVQAFRNSSAVSAVVFLRHCEDDEFLRYGDLTAEAGTLLFAFAVDDTGEVQVDVSASQLVLNVSDQTWSVLQEACDPNDVLPAFAVDGLSQDLDVTSRPASPVADSLTTGFEFLSRTLKALAFQERLEGKSAVQLMTIAERSRLALQATRSEQSRRHLKTFGHHVKILDRQGKIDAKGAQLLVDGTVELRDELAGFRDLALPDPDPALAACREAGAVASCPDTLSGCAFTILHVDAATTAGEPNGTRAQPFPTIGAALARAESMDSCGVSVRVQPGIYEEDLSITRHTKILGTLDEQEPFGGPFVAGTLSNTGPHFLELRDLTLTATVERAAVGLRVAHPCASTRLDQVAILGYRGLGLHQTSGSFAFVDLQVSGSRAIEGKPSAGTALLLTCGARGRMTDVNLRGNESAGLITAGSGTEVEAFGLTVVGTRVHSDFLAQLPTGVPWGAVHVRDEATLTVRGFHIAHNWFLGIRADAGAEAFFEQGTVAGTLGLDRVAPESSAPPGGINLASLESARLRIWDFVSTRANLCGAQVARDGELDLIGRSVLDESGRSVFTSEVSHSTIGACVHVPGYDASRLATGVTYRHNDINFESVGFFIPEPATPSL